VILVPIRRRRVPEVLDALPGHPPREQLSGAELLEAEKRSARERWQRTDDSTPTSAASVCGWSRLPDVAKDSS
jgi:hypothetical protein